MKRSLAVSPHALWWIANVQGTQRSVKHKKGWCALHDGIERTCLLHLRQCNQSFRGYKNPGFILQLRLLCWEVLLKPEQNRSKLCPHTFLRGCWVLALLERHTPSGTWSRRNDTLETAQKYPDRQARVQRREMGFP